MSLRRLGITGVWLYFLLLGAIYFGLTTAPLRVLSVLFLTVYIGCWLLYRRDEWFRSPFDGLALLWAVVIGLSLLTNGSTTNLQLGAWIHLLAWGLTLLVADQIAQGMPRRWFIDAAVSILFPLFISCVLEAWPWLAAILSGAQSNGVPRLNSLYGNPNVLAAALLLTVPMVAMRTLYSQGQARLGWLAVLSMGLIMLFIAQSRGAWLGVFTSLIVVGGLEGWRRYGTPMRAWWQRLSVKQRTGLLIGVLALAIIVSLAIFWLVVLRVDRGGSDKLRMDIWSTAIAQIQHAPIFGNGPNTFGHALLDRFAPVPDGTDGLAAGHTHAHSVILQVMAELGVAGLGALILSAVILVRAWWRNLQLAQAEMTQQPLIYADFVGIGGALAAFATQSVTDTPASFPAIFMLSILLLAVGASPLQTVLLPAHQWRTKLVTVGWLGLLLAAWLNLLYFVTVSRAIDQHNLRHYADSAVTLVPALAAAPDVVSVYRMAGFAAASQQDWPTAISAYQHVLTYQQDIVSMLNLGALYRRIQQPDRAVAMLAHAYQLQPRHPAVAINYGLALEAAGQSDMALKVYQQALLDSPTLSAEPLWTSTMLRQQARLQTLADPRYEPAPVAHLWGLLQDGDLTAAQRAAQTMIESKPSNSLGYSFLAITALASNDTEEAGRQLHFAQLRLGNDMERAWYALAHYRLAQAQQDRRAEAEYLATLTTLLTSDENGLTFGYLIGQAHTQFWLPDTSYHLLPLVWWPTLEATIAQVLGLPPNLPLQP